MTIRIHKIVLAILYFTLFNACGSSDSSVDDKSARNGSLFYRVVKLNLNRIYKIIALVPIVTYAQGCAFLTPIDMLNGLDGLSRFSTSPPDKIRCEPVDNSTSLAAPKLPGDAADKPPASTDVAGFYVSEITGNKDQLDAKLRILTVRISQDGSEIEGTFGDFGGELEGTIEGETIIFDWYSSWTHGTGEWQVKPGSNDLSGTWKTTSGYEGSGKWNLTLCRKAI